MVDPVSAATAIPSLLLTLTKVVQQCNDIRSKYKSAEWGIGNIASECAVVRAALGQLQDLLDGMDAETWKTQASDGPIIASLDEVTIACTSTFSLLSEYLSDASDVVDDSSSDRSSGPSRKQRANFVWNEDRVKSFMAQLRGHQSSLTLLLTVVQIRSEQDTKRILLDQRALLLDIRNMLRMPARSEYRMSSFSGDTVQAVSEKVPVPSVPEDIVEAPFGQATTDSPAGEKNNTEEKSSLDNVADLITFEVTSKEPLIQAATPVARDFQIASERQPGPVKMPSPATSKRTPKVRFASAGTVAGAIKCVVVGDSSCNKTKLITCWTTGEYPSEYSPAIYDNFAVNISVDGTVYKLGLFDMAGQEDYDRLRPLSYPQTDVFILAFSIADPSSFESIRTKWYPELQRHAPGVPIVLTGVKKALRDDPKVLEQLGLRGRQPVRAHEGLELARVVSAHRYIECDALTGDNVDALFDEAINAVLNPNMGMFRKVKKSRFSFSRAGSKAGENSLLN